MSIQGDIDCLRHLAPNTHPSQDTPLSRSAPRSARIFQLVVVMQFIPVSDSAETTRDSSEFRIDAPAHGTTQSSNSVHRRLPSGESIGSQSSQSIIENVSVNDPPVASDYENDSASLLQASIPEACCLYRGSQDSSLAASRTSSLSVKSTGLSTATATLYLPATITSFPVTVADLPATAAFFASLATDRLTPKSVAFSVTATGLRQCWPVSQAVHMTIDCLEWHESMGSIHHYILFQLTSAARGKSLWLRLGRRSRRHSRESRLRSVAGPATLPVDQIAPDDYAVVSCDKDDLLVSWRSFTLRETINEPISFSFMLDVLDLAHMNLDSSGDDSSVYASFIMNAMHQRSESASILSGRSSSTQHNNSRYIENFHVPQIV